MKKYIVIAVVLVACFAFTASAFAVITNAITSATSLGSASFTPSTNVTVKPYTANTAYCVTSQHSSSNSSNGGKMYGSLNTSATIVSKTALDSAGPTACGDSATLPTGMQ